MTRRALPWLSGLAILVAGFLVYQAGPGETIVVRSGQAGGDTGVWLPSASVLATPAAWPERMTVDVDEVLVVRFEPTPTRPPLPKRDTPTAFPSCPQPGALCQWPQPTPTWNIEPTPTPYPACVTPVPGDRCQDVARVATPEARCWSAGWQRRVCWPAGCRALAEEWC